MPTFSARSLLIDELNNAFNSRSWHGANLLGALHGVAPQQAARKPQGRKSIWQQLLHAAYWKHRVLITFHENWKFPRAGVNWSKNPTHPTLDQWRADIAMLEELHGQLIDAVKNIPVSKLTRKVRWLLHGAAAHDAYHAGQIKLLRRLK